MDFYGGVTTRLLTDPAVSCIVDQRVNWGLRPQGELLPAVTLQVVSDPRPVHLKGFDGARATRLQCDCWAETMMQALALARAVIAVLKNPATVSGKKFGNALVDGQRDLGETVGSGGDAQSSGTFIHRQSVDFIVWHRGD
ncbi:tail completion protein gp17 [Sphingobium chungbukense]|uniref:DUF3168 domain-containing protein n=1 Tax=Sphingobium chungbukense TaxID=56193 RepID=A0A0M3AUJ8_9SPHN|nr:DUF3168 domain-containing protein [Sphingobium chungbukense]KKW93872.1 hypothetical protein YP76_04235 [Sphingobium chungbukense]